MQRGARVMSNKIKGKLFLNRIDELRMIRSLIKELLSGRPIERPVRYFYGVPMVGKTALLLEIKKYSVDKFGIPTAYIDFDPSQNIFDKPILNRYKDKSAIYNLINDISQQLKITPNHSTDNVDKDNAAKSFIGTFLQDKKRSQKPLILLFDSLEEVDENTFEHLQNDVLVPLLENRNTLVIFAARAHFRELHITFDWSIRRQLMTHPLRPFTFEQTKDHIARLSKGTSTIFDRSNVVYDITNGIPGLNEFVVFNIKNENGRMQNRVVENAIFKRVPKAKKEIDILTPISVYRLFDTELLAYLANNLEIPVSEKNEKHLGTNLLIRLLDTTLVEQRVDGTGYVVVEDMRKIFYNYLGKINPDKISRIHTLAYKWFETEVAKGDVVLLANMIYHQAGIWFHESLKERDKEFIEDRDKLKQLKNILNNKLKTLKKNPRMPMLVEKIKKQLENEEFEWFLNKEEIAALVEYCDTYQKTKNTSTVK